MTRKQFVKEFRRFYIQDINNSRRAKDIEMREHVIEKLLDGILFSCYEWNNGETPEREFLEYEFNIIVDKIAEDDFTYLKNNYNIDISNLKGIA